MPRTSLLSCLLLLGLLACGADSKSSHRKGSRNQPDLSQNCDRQSALQGELHFKRANWKTDFCKRAVDLREIRSGGPPRDGIPPIDAPTFVTPSDADRWIRDVEPVIAVAHGGVARAYPLQILIWHEIVNDELDGVPIAVTFCPLCYAAVVFKRPTVDGRELSFGTSGNLRKSDMVMWDRQTESWWQQFEGTAIVGVLTGTRLEQLPGGIVSWKDFKAAHPKGEVLSRDTGIPRPYGKNPYVGYDDIRKKPFLYQGKVGKGLAPMEHVVGIERGETAVAYPLKTLRERRVIHDQVLGEEVVVFWQKGTASALDKKHIADGFDAGATGAFSPIVEGRRLRFRPDGDSGFIDAETSSHWSILGDATSGPLAGRQLVPLAHHRVFWFAWSAFVAERGSLYSD